MDREQYLDLLLGLPRLYGPQVSSDGRWVAWTWYSVGPAADVYVAPTDGSAAPVRLTNTDENTMLVSWAPDSRSVLVSQDRHGDERARLFLVNLDRPGEMEPLTEESPHYYIRGGQLHPNGHDLIYAANIDVATGDEVDQTLLYRHNVETGERVPLARPTRPCYYEPKLNSAGTHILYNRNELDPSGQQVWLVDLETGEDREIINAGDDKKAYASWLPDGRRAVVLAETDTHLRVGV